MASSKRNYDVFLSFRGTDVRNNFLSHLYADLDRNGIHTFKDSEELWKGEEISPALMRAIKESRIAIIIFSKDYASSRWCLQELAKIMECKDLIVLLVFFKVKPGEVRGLKEGYGTAMDMHKSEGRDPATVERWKNALVGASNLAGWDYNNEDEAEFIRGIVEQVSSYLVRTTPSYVAKYPVGINSRVREVISLLQKKSHVDDVLMIGIWGLGGIGKTTIARAIYFAIKRQFGGSSFLDRVRETSNKCNGLVELQQKILSQILSPPDLKVPSEGEGCSLIRERLCNKKVLLVLDDVDDKHQLDMLAGGGDWFGKGSRIFVTSRDKHVLTSHGINHVYEIEPLDHVEALDLFNQHAFPNCQKPEIRKDLIDRAMHYASGLPLALEVLGSFLCGRNEPAWESELDKLSNSPKENIDRILKISFYGLEKTEKDIFLDIACFFKGKSIEYITEILDSCNFATTIGIEILIERSLIRNEHGTLEMHDLVQLMGKNIVMQDNPRQRSRLWLFKDVLDILCEEKGTEAIEAIVVELLTPEERDLSLEEITIEVDTFKKMTNLRMLNLPVAHISSEGLVHLPSNLRWLKWPNAPLPKFGSGPKKLIGLDLRDSHIKRSDDIFKHFRKLKYINFSQCKSLVSVPDFSSTPNLESLILDGCKSLVEIHQSVACHDKLKFLSLQFCSNLSNFPNTIKTKSLQALLLFGCTKLEKFDIPEKIEYLEELDLGRTAITELPKPVENLLSLKIINLERCKNLTTLPSTIFEWQNLELLNLAGCSNLVWFPKNLEDSIERDLSLEEITIEVDAFKKMTNLIMLNLPEAHISSEGPVHLPSTMRWLQWPNAPLQSVDPKQLVVLDPQESHIRQLDDPKQLVVLDLQKSDIRRLDDNFKQFIRLTHINFNQCESLVSVPDFSSSPNLQSLILDGCKSLVEIHQSVACHDELKILSLRFCSNLSIFPNTLKTKSLQALHLFGCTKLEKLFDMPEKMEYLEELDLGRTAITELPKPAENLLSLRILNLEGCKNLTTLPSNVFKWQNLELLNLAGCSNCVTFPMNLEDSNNPNGNPGFR